MARTKTKTALVLSQAETEVDSGGDESVSYIEFDEGHEDYITVTVAGSGSTPWYHVGNCTSIIVVATGTAKFYSCNEDKSIVRELTMAGQVQTATATKCGLICQDAMPLYVRVTDTSTSSNPMTIYFNRSSRQARGTSISGRVLG